MRGTWIVLHTAIATIAIVLLILVVRVDQMISLVSRGLGSQPKESSKRLPSLLRSRQ
jgi:hypothetical protein